MTNKDELKRVIQKQFAPFAFENGYCSKIKEYYYRCDGNIIKAIGFSAKSGGYEPYYFVQPLYMPFDYLILSYGRSMTRGLLFRVPPLRLNIPGMWERSIAGTQDYLKNHVLDFFSKINRAQDMYKCIDSHKFFTPPYERDELKFYSAVYAKDYDRVYNFYKAGTSGENIWTKERMESLYAVFCENPDKAQKILEENVSHNVEVMKINVN